MLTTILLLSVRNLPILNKVIWVNNLQHQVLKLILKLCLILVAPHVKQPLVIMFPVLRSYRVSSRFELENHNWILIVNVKVQWQFIGIKFAYPPTSD